MPVFISSIVDMIYWYYYMGDLTFDIVCQLLAALSLQSTYYVKQRHLCIGPGVSSYYVACCGTYEGNTTLPFCICMLCFCKKSDIVPLNLLLARDPITLLSAAMHTTSNQ